MGGEKGEEYRDGREKGGEGRIGMGEENRDRRGEKRGV
jgi:hypothetical protein